MAHRLRACCGSFLSCVLDPIDNPSADDVNVPVVSSMIKTITVGLGILALTTTLVLVTVCAQYGGKELSWPVAGGVSALVWVICALIAVGLFLSHPYYAERVLRGWKTSRTHVNVLLDPADAEISLDE
jgi:hypothetical protein